MSKAVFSLLLIAACGLTSCSPSRGAVQRLTLTGSSTIAPLASEIASQFEQEHPGVRIDVQTGGSSRGIADTRSGLADIGMVSRSLKAEESDLAAHPIARDGICMIVHSSNPVSVLSEEQIIAIYAGKLTNWQDAGGQDEPITVVTKAEGRSTLELFLKHFKMKSPDVKPSVVIGDNEQGIKTVSGDPNAIGYVSIGAAEYAASTGIQLKLLPLNGVEASIKNLKAGTFPLARELNIVTNGTPAELVQAFIDYAQSSRVHPLIEGLYFVPIE